MAKMRAVRYPGPKMETEASPTTMFQGAHLRVTATGHGNANLMVTFDNWVRDKDGFGAPLNSQRFAELGFRQIHIATARNDWFLNDDLFKVLDLVQRAAQGHDRVMSLSFSMGGFGALLASRFVAFDQFLLVSPQTSHDPELPPYDTRFASDLANTDTVQPGYALLRRPEKSTGRCVVLFDSLSPPDRAHARRAAGVFRDSRIVDLKGGGHPATGALAENTRFGLIQKAFLGPYLRVRPIVRAHNQIMRDRRARG